jgi:hypothetical protein
VPDTTRLLVEVDGNALSDDDLRGLTEIQVEEATEIADAATLVASLEANASGEWTSVLDPLLTPLTKVAIQVSRGETTYRFEGASTEAHWTINPQGDSLLSITAVDRTLELDNEEKIVAWPGCSDSVIAETIFTSYGFEIQVDSTPDNPDPDVHVVLQRGSDLTFVRELAAKWGYAAFLEAGEAGVTGHFHPIDPLAEPQGELALGFGSDAQNVSAGVRLLDGHRVKISRIPALSDSPQDAESAGDDQAQGAHSLAAQAIVLLTPGDVSGELDPSSTAEGLARHSAFAAHLDVEVDADRVGLMLRARKPVLVRGLGNALSGRYLVDRVRHIVTLDRHRQQLSLSRNALGLSGDEPFGATGGIGVLS